MTASISLPSFLKLSSSSFTSSVLHHRLLALSTFSLTVASSPLCLHMYPHLTNQVVAAVGPSLHLRSQPDHPSIPKPCPIKLPRKPFNVFIAHRGPDTKKKEATLIYDYLQGGGYSPFLDAESLMPGEKIPDGIDEALCESRLGIIIFSPRFGESHHCLDELVRLIEMGKPLLPVFSDIDPSEVRVAEYRVERDTAEKVKQYTDALEEAKQIRGIVFKPRTGNWPKLGRDTTRAVDRTFLELGLEVPPRHKGHPGFYTASDHTPGLASPISDKFR